MAGRWQRAASHKNPRAEHKTCSMEGFFFWAVGVFVSAYLVSRNVLCPSVMFWHQNIIPQSLCLAVSPQSLKDYEKSHPYVRKQMREGRGWCKTWLPPSALPRYSRCTRWFRPGRTAPWHFFFFFFTIPSLYPSPPDMLPSRSDIPDIPPLPPLIPRFHIPPRPSSVHPSTHCVMSLLCESEQFVWQPECNATPLTWESQQSVVLVRETCLGAAVRCEFYRKRTSSGAKPKTKKWTMVNIRSSG